MPQPRIIAAKKADELMPGGKLPQGQGFGQPGMITENIGVAPHAEWPDRATAQDIAHGLPPSLVTMEELLA